MANKEPNQLDTGDPIVDTDVFISDQGGSPWVTVKVTAAMLYAYLLAKLETALRLIPSGGGNGEYLRKAGIDDYDVEWSADGLVPDSSNTGYVLTQIDGTAGNYAFASIRRLPEPVGGDDDKFVQYDGAGSFILAFPPDQSAGSSGQLQYRAGGGGFAAAALAGIGSTGSFELSLDVAPPTPAAGRMGTHAAGVSGIELPAWIASDGDERLIGPSLLSQAVRAYLPQPSANALTTSGLVAATANGSNSAKTTTGASPYTSMVGLIYTSAASAGSNASIRNNQLYAFLGDAARAGGFEIYFKFAFHAISTNCRSFVGLYSSTGLLGNIDPSTLTSLIGIGHDTGDANLQIIHNDSSGTATKIDLGAGFPANTAQTDVYDALFVARPYSGSGAHKAMYRVVNQTTGVVAVGLISSDLPAGTQGLGHHAWINNGSDASAVAIVVGAINVLV